MTRAHEQARFLEPADGAAEVGAIHREYLELLIGQLADVAGDVGCFPVPRTSEWIAEDGQLGLVHGKLVQSSERDPTVA